MLVIKDNYIMTHTEGGKCVVAISADKKIWTITSWFVNKEKQNRGIGKSLMKEVINYLYNNYGYPMEVEYIWNGAKDYVGR